MEDRIVSVTTDLVAIPTHDTEQAAQEYLSDVFGAAGFTCELQQIADGRPNLLARRGDAGAFLCSHVDTHPPHDHPDPLTCRRDGDVLVGRGVLDAKGQIAAIVAAVEAEPDMDATVLITCDEEATGLGSEHAKVPDGPWSSDGGIVLEPTGFRICTAQTGHVDVRVDASAASVHAYSPDRPGSPLHAVLAAIEELDTCNFAKATHPLLGRAPRNIGTLHAGEHAWRTPSRASVEMTLGVVPPTDVAEAEREVRTRLDEIARRWANQGTSFSYEVTDRSEAIEVASDLPVAIRLAEAMGTRPEVAGMTSWTDAGNLKVKHGLDCVVFGAGDIAMAHSNHETVAVADLVRLAEILAAVLRTGGTAR